MEVWKDIKSYEGKYQVSNLGRVKSLNRVVKYADKSVKNIKERILKRGKDKYGYLHVNLCVNGKRRTIKIHRLVADHFTPNSENKPHVNHINGIKTDNHVNNLEWCTPKENTKHAFDNKLKKTPKGEKHYKSKLTKEIAFKIKYLYKGLTQKEIAKKYKIDQSLVSGIRTGRNWKHI